MAAAKIEKENLPGKKPFKKLIDVEKEHILFVLQELHWRKDVAARVLGIDRKTLYRRLSEYGVITKYEKVPVIKEVSYVPMKEAQ